MTKGIAGIALVLAGCAMSRVAPGPVPPALATLAGCEAREVELRFRFHSSFWLNLHNFLYREAGVRAGRMERAGDPFGNLAVEIAPVRELSDGERATWERAVRFYEDVVRTRGLRDSVVVEVNNALGRAGMASDIEVLPLDAAWADALEAAAPLYAAAWWPAHDSVNRRWIAAAEGQLERHGSCLDAPLARALGGAWGGDPARVDVSVYASWFGAYTTLDPLHITVSSTAAGTQGTYALETLLHESAHALLPALRSGFAGEPAEVTHLVLFYVTGELVRARIPGHVPFGYRFNTWARLPETRALHQRIRAAWLPVLEGRATPADGLAALRSR